MTPHSRRFREGSTIAMACLAPWAFGSVEAWAELLIESGIGLIAVLGAVEGWRSGRSSRVICLPGLALLGLALLALAQASPWPEGVLRKIAPSAAATRDRLVPRVSVGIQGDLGPAISSPEWTISQDPDLSLHEATRLAAAWVLFQAVIGLGGGYPALRRLGVALVINATLLSLVALIQALTWNGKIFWFRISPMDNGWATGGPFVGHGPLAAYLNLGLGFAVAALRGKDGWTRLNPAPAYALGVIAVGIVASQSRTGAVASLVSAALFAAWRQPSGRRFVLGLVAILIPASLLLLVVGISSHMARLGTIADPLSYSPRVEIWRASLRAWSGHPVWGSGLGTFAVALRPEIRADLGHFFARAENEYVDLLVEGGVIGLALGLLALGGTARLGLRALDAAPSPRNRSAVLAALFGGLTLAIHSLGDFALHIPGVAVAAVILAAHLCGLGLDTLRPSPAGMTGRVRRPLVAVAMVFAIVLVIRHGWELACSEAELAETDVPLPGSTLAAGEDGRMPGIALEARREALERAIAHRPRWTEGHLRLGLTHLDLYRQKVEDWVADEIDDPAMLPEIVDPLWLHGAIHTESADGHGRASTFLEHSPIRDHLIPAARSFLVARGCGPTLALPHAQLAQLDFLLIGGGESTSEHAERALRQAGASGRMLARLASLALHVGDIDLACRCWRRSLEARNLGWEAVADASDAALMPEDILDRVLPPGGQFAVRFADRLFSDPGEHAHRERFLRAALECLPDDRDLTTAERLALEAHARAGLGEAKLAWGRMEEALALDPTRAAWRQELAEWATARGDLEEARRQVLIGLHLTPGHPGLTRMLGITVDRLARGEATTPGTTSP